MRAHQLSSPECGNPAVLERHHYPLIKLCARSDPNAALKICGPGQGSSPRATPGGVDGQGRIPAQMLILSSDGRLKLRMGCILLGQKQNRPSLHSRTSAVLGLNS
ncbi:hypothetical protein TNCV_3778131 [Trichonephila clavipes]|nr:hypothetical protein TNCV_3778131 [Trichonephila clavipes]